MQMNLMRHVLSLSGYSFAGRLQIMILCCKLTDCEICDHINLTALKIKIMNILHGTFYLE